MEDGYVMIQKGGEIEWKEMGRKNNVNSLHFEGILYDRFFNSK
jgi:hypothetical protein